MIAGLIRWSLHNRFLVLLATVMVAVWGVWSMLKTPLISFGANSKPAVRYSIEKISSVLAICQSGNNWYSLPKNTLL